MHSKSIETYIKGIDRDRTRTCNPQIRSLVPYPLGHTVLCVGWVSPITPGVASHQSMLQSSVKTTFHLHNKKSFWSFLWVTRHTGFWDKRIRQNSKYGPVYSILFHKIQKSCNHDRIWICIQHISILYHRYSSNKLRSSVLMTCVLCSDTVLASYPVERNTQL